MSYQLEFAVKHIYDSRKIGITVKAILRRGNAYAVCDAKIDTGSDFCLFGREFAEELDIEVETGYRQNLSTLAGGLAAYGHDIELETLGLTFDTFVYFAEDYAIKRNLLGRRGWLQLIKLGLDDYGSKIYISPNQENF